MITAIAGALALYMIWKLYGDTACSSCGQRVKNSDDCWRRR